MRSILLILNLILLTTVTVTVGLFDRQVQGSTVDALTGDILYLKQKYVTTGATLIFYFLRSEDCLEVNNIFSNTLLLLASADTFINDLDPPLNVNTSSYNRTSLLEVCFRKLRHLSLRKFNYDGW